MHDLLGHSLTTVTVKAALASRLVDSDPDRAKVEMQDVDALGKAGATKGVVDNRAASGDAEAGMQ